VFKIKKPVELPFVDFSTFDHRERACRAEVTVNRRLAPRTYLGVVPIRRSPQGKATFGPRGPIVEWAVRMVRLDDARQADVLLEQGELTKELIDTLAVGIAGFHADAATNADICAFGDPVLIERNVIDNFQALETSAANFVTSQEAWELQRWQL